MPTPRTGSPSLASLISGFGSAVTQKLANPRAHGNPEDQLRAPFERLISGLAELLHLPPGAVVAVGESAVNDLQTRPDYAITDRSRLTGFVELKATGAGADPRKFKKKHDKAQWQKLRALPNLIYTDGNAFSLWQNGELVEGIVDLIGDVESSGGKLAAPPSLLVLFERFFLWQPIPPRSARELAHVTARLCRLLRDEVTEQLGRKSDALTALAADWRKLLFPEATDERFADGYAQAVTFGLLMARAKGISLATGMPQVAAELSTTNSLIGAALRLLTDNAENQATLRTSLGTLTRVLDAVTWAAISKGESDAWLYFYEEFLEIYDNELRKKTGSYYTPPEVVRAMVALVDEALQSSRYGLHTGLAAPVVTVADPAVGTGTFLLGVLRKIADNVGVDQGPGAVSAAINAAVKRLIAFEIQLGPFAVAQLRLLAEIIALGGHGPSTPLRMFVTDTLGNPESEDSWIPNILAPIAESRKAANRIKRDEPVTVVIGNPPYKEKAKGLGSWVEGGDPSQKPPVPGLLMDWMPPREWKAGAHSKHLRNLYVYFWRWATWKVYDHHQNSRSGIVCFITVAGFLGGRGFQKMRDYLRRTCDDIWVIDCSPEGHQPEVNTRIFQDVQQPVCIVMASRSAMKDPAKPATVRFRALPSAHRLDKFKAMASLSLKDREWVDCPYEWRAPFLPASKGAWATFPSLADFFVYNGSGVMPGRTWIIAPEAESLHRRWQALIAAPVAEKETLFHPHLRKGKLGDKHSKKTVLTPLAGYPSRTKPVADDDAACVQPTRYGFRSFDRQWIIPDSRLINQPNPELWAAHSESQIYLTAFTEESPTNGPALTFTCLLPDLHHYKGSFGGRVFPLWRDTAANVPNVQPNLLGFLTSKYGVPVTAEDLLAYIAATAAHPGFTIRFQDDLSTPGLHIPLTANPSTFAEAALLGRNVIWIHSFGERMIDPAMGRPARPPRMPKGRMPYVPDEGAIPEDPDSMPDAITYDSAARRLYVGNGFVANVDPAVWAYQVSGKQVLLQWFSYRRKTRDRPMIGDRRPQSPLCDIQPDHWLPEYTTELLNVLNVLGLLVDIEPQQAALLGRICSGRTFSITEIHALATERYTAKRRRADPKQATFLSDSETATSRVARSSP
jgi:hypothetical protein